MNKFVIMAAFLLVAVACHAQQTQSLNNKYSRDTTIRDTVPGMVVLADSTLRLVDDSQGRYFLLHSDPTAGIGSARPLDLKKELGTVVKPAYCVKVYKWLVRASDGGLDPYTVRFDFFYPDGATVDKKVLQFIPNDPTR